MKMTVGDLLHVISPSTPVELCDVSTILKTHHPSRFTEEVLVAIGLFDANVILIRPVVNDDLTIRLRILCNKEG